MTRGTGFGRPKTEDKLLRQEAEEMGYRFEAPHPEVIAVFKLPDRVIWMGGQGWQARNKDDSGAFVGPPRVYGYKEAGLRKALTEELQLHQDAPI